MTILHVSRCCWATWAFRLLRERYPHRGLNRNKLSQTEWNIDSENESKWVRIWRHGTRSHVWTQDMINMKDMKDVREKKQKKTWKKWNKKNEKIRRIGRMFGRLNEFDVLAKLFQWLIGLGCRLSRHFDTRNPARLPAFAAVISCACAPTGNAKTTTWHHILKDCWNSTKWGGKKTNQLWFWM